MSLTPNAAVTVALALATGMVAQSLARHLKLPGIVLLLGAGVLLGPDLAGIVQPRTLGPALEILVGFAVAVILFEGGLNLSVKRLLGQAMVIRRLLTWGAVITAAGATLAAHELMEWGWRLSSLFGALVIVTGPTVITPLLRRIRVHHRVETVLEAEGVLVDAIGAVVAVVALQVAISPTGASAAFGFLGILGRLSFGIAVGAVGGLALALLLRVKRVVPEGLENVFVLSLVLALFQVSNAFLEESGIMTVTAAGLVVGNMKTHVKRELMEFKEQLTVMFIGMLFVLLAADVRVDDIVALGWPGLITVACLMFVVRPLNVATCTIGSDLDWRERTFLSWLSPRGVVAAAVASLFAHEIERFGIEGGLELRALVFLVIATTVLVQGLSGGLVASMLGLRRGTNRGFVILGGNALGHNLGRALRDAGEEVVFLDNNPGDSRVVEEDGFRVIFGNALEERTLQRARLEDRAAFIAATSNEKINLLIAQMIIDQFRSCRVYVAVRQERSSITPGLVEKMGGRVLFGEPRDLELWSVRLRRKIALVEKRKLTADSAGPLEAPRGVLLPLAVRRGNKAFPVHDGEPLKKNDVVDVAVFAEGRDAADAWFAEHSWEACEPEPPR